MAPLVFRRLEVVTGVAVAVVAAAGASGPGWLAAAEHVTAARLGEPLAAAPGHGALAQLAQLIPIGEVGDRVALVSAVAAGVLAAGLIALARALVPRDHVAGVGAMLALAVTAGMRIAATTPGPAMMAAAGVVWTVAGLVRLRVGLAPRASELAQDDVARGDAMAVGGLSIALAAAPWIGLALLPLVVLLIWRRPEARRILLVVPVAVFVPLLVVAGVPPLAAGFGGRVRALIGALGADAGVIVLGAGLLGLGFALATGLRGAGIAIVAVLAVAVGAAVSPIAGADGAVAVGAILAVGIAIIAAAAVRAIAGASEGTPRALAAIALSLAFPLLGLVLATGVAGDADGPARAAADVVDPGPAGPGAVFVGTPLITAVRHERVVAGLRPDLMVGLRAGAADAIAVNLMRQGRIAIADVPAFGQLDDRLARPAGRGFELLLVEAEADAPPRPPATYPGAIGSEVAARLALARGLWEAGAGRLDHAAHAAGLAGTRFDAGAVAVFAATAPSARRPALFGFIPELGTADPRMWLDLLGDDLAWVADLAEPPLPATAAPERRLHARWRAVLAGIAPPADPAIRALGKPAVVATRAMLTAIGHQDAADKLAP